jgi:hypothetical protein
MKTKSIILALCLCCTALAEQRIVVVPCKDGRAQIPELEKRLMEGWRVITATPVVDSDSMALGKPKQGYTTSIIFVIERN